MAINKVVYNNNTLLDLTDTTATASDVAQGKYFYNIAGVRTEGTNQGGSGDGYVWQDAQGYVHLSDEQGTQPIYDTLTVSSSGTFTPSQGHAYNSVIVPSADPYTAFYNNHFYTENNQRKWSITSLSEVDAGEGDTPGWLPDGFRETSDYVVNAVPQNTTVTPTTSAQTIGGANYMMEGAVTVSAMPTGTAGTPTATKGTVSNHSVSVTPSVTNTTGYITGSTKTGTAVTVSASELVSGTKSITDNGTGIDVTNYASVDVNVSSQGGSSYELIASTTYTVQTTSTTEILVGTFQTGDTSIWTSDKMVYVKIRDTAGRRNGYFYGSDSMFCNNVPGNGLSSTTSYLMHGTSYYQNNAGYLINFTLQRTTTSNYTTGYGVYPTKIYSSGDIDIRARYNSTTLTINGTFQVDVYLLDWPGNVNPFNG